MQPYEKGLWLVGMNREEPAAPSTMWWARGEIDQCEADREIQQCHQKFVEGLKEMFVNPPPPRTPEEMQVLSLLFSLCALLVQKYKC